jgi:hypothetical protein
VWIGTPWRAPVRRQWQLPKADLGVAGLIVLPGEARRGEIVVQTRRGSELSNSQSFDVSLYEQQANRDLQERHPGAEMRTPPIGVYNCHGMTFAARRTRIFEPASVRQVLVEDEYCEVALEKVLEGDVIVYYSEDGDVSHSGVVVRVDRLDPGNPASVKTPYVWSKWGSGSEFLHQWADCPYVRDQPNTTVKYYRILS